MKNFILNILITGLATYITARLLPWVYIDGFGWALLFAAVLAVMNASVGLVLKFITFPLNILTLGLVYFFINVLMVMLTDNLIEGIVINGFWVAVLFALVVSVFSTVIYKLIK